MWERLHNRRSMECPANRRQSIGLLIGAVLALVWIGCPRPNVVPPTASVPRLLPPVPVGTFESRVPASPSFESRVIPDEELWQPKEQPRDWKTIVVHHTATTTGSVESIHETHLRKKDSRGNPWLGIGYHFVIGNGQGMTDGDVEPTFRWRQQLHGAHAGVGDYNETGIGIVLIGNFEKNAPTQPQLQGLRRLVGYLTRTFEISSDAILGHGDIKATACPGRYFPLADIRAGVAALDDSGGPPLARFVPATGISRKEALRP